MSTGGPGSRAPTKYAALRGRVRELFEEGGRNWGYRTIWARLRREGRRASEKVVRRLMREEGLEVVYNRRRRRGWSSYEGEVSAAPPNLVARDFSAAAPDELWVTDVTEFRVPAGKVYLSAVVDCYDGRPAGWRIGPRPTASLANGSLLDALAARREGAHRGAQRPRGPLPVAGVDRDLRGARARALDVGQGVQPRQRGLRGVLREAQERVLPLPGLGGRLARGVLRDAGRLPAVLLLGEDQALARVAEPGRVPPQRGLGGVGRYEKRPHP